MRRRPTDHPIDHLLAPIGMLLTPGITRSVAVLALPPSPPLLQTGYHLNRPSYRPIPPLRPALALPAAQGSNTAPPRARNETLGA